MKALFIVGEPGAGKTSLVRLLIAKQLAAAYAHPSPKWTLFSHPKLLNVALAGHYSGQPFDGADGVPYNGVEAALDYLFERQDELAFAIFDGDRFSYPGVLARLRLRGIEPLCAYLDVPRDIGEYRRRARAELLGRPLQNEAWVRGRITKAKRFAEKFADEERSEHRLKVLNGDQAGLDIARDLVDWLERHVPNG